MRAGTSIGSLEIVFYIKVLLKKAGSTYWNGAGWETPPGRLAPWMLARIGSMDSADAPSRRGKQSGRRLTAGEFPARTTTHVVFACVAHGG